MKKKLVNLLAVSSVGLLILASCKKNDSVITANTNKAGQFTASTTTPAIQVSKVKDTTSIITFNFTASNYGAPVVEQNNILQVDAVGDNWKNPASYTLPKNATTLGLSTAAFDLLLLKVVSPGTSSKQVAVRVEHQLSSATNFYSNVINMTVTPINLTSWIYVPGDYEGWANNANSAAAPHEDSLVSVTGNGIYVGIIDFRGYAGSTGSLQYKIVPTKGDWSVAYGDAGGGTISTSGGNLTVPTAKPYLLTVNLNNNTITAVPANYYSVIGDAALGWGTDSEMKYLNDGSGTWVNTLALVSTGSFKIRENDDWTWSWGIPKAGTAGDGVPNTLNDSSNNNITISASGNYKIIFNYPATAASTGFTPAVTVTYSVTKQ